MNMSRVIRARGYGPAMRMYDQTPTPRLDQAPGHNLLPGPTKSIVHTGRDDGPTDWQRLQAYKAHLKAHYDEYKDWLRESRP